VREVTSYDRLYDKPADDVVEITRLYAFRVRLG
jgi:hypothetical protein